MKLDLYGGKGFVRLLDTIPSSIPEGFSTKDAEIVLNAHISRGSPTEDEHVQEFIEKLFKWGHYSPFEQATLKFEVRAPLINFWQMDRHRSFLYGSHIRRSGRYTEFSEDDFYIPEYFKDYEGTGPKWDGVDDLKFLIRGSIQAYQEYLEQGMPKESARFFLPAYCLMYTEVMTVDLKNLFHFLALRTDEKAQREIRELANAMLKLTRQEFPISIMVFEDNLEPVNYNLGGS